MITVAPLIRRTLTAGALLLLSAALAAQTPAPAAPAAMLTETAAHPPAPAAPAIAMQTPAPAPEAPQAPAAPQSPATPQPAPEPAKPPRPPRPPRASTHVLMGNGFGAGSGFGWGGSFLGVDVVDITSERVSMLKLPDESGVEITAVDQDSPAGKAQLKEHDVIRTFNGEKVESTEQLRRLIRETPAGRTVDLGLFRDGKPLSVKVQLADRQELVKTITIPRIHVNPPVVSFPEGFPFEVVRSSRSGMQLETLTPQLREFFGVPSGQGLLVRSVEKGSNAETAGIRAGDVIVKAANQPVHTLADLQLAMRGAANGAVAVTIVREKREQTLNLKIPEGLKQGGTLLYDFPGATLADLADVAGLMANSEELRQFAEQQKAWSKQFKDSQKEWQKQLEKEMKELQKQKQKWDEDED